MITDRDITKLKEVFATKEDFQHLNVKVNAMALDLEDVKGTVNRIDKRTMEDSNYMAKLHLEHERNFKKIKKILNIKV